MKQKRANTKGSMIRHLIHTAPAGAIETSRTYSARCSLKIERGKIVYRWRVFAPQAKRGAK